MHLNDLIERLGWAKMSEEPYIKSLATDSLAAIDQLREALSESVAMLEIYYIPNSDGSTPTIDKAKALLESDFGKFVLNRSMGEP